MKICIAQTQSVKGDIQENIGKHRLFIQKAIELEADLIVFPELSLTGYEPDIAKRIATNSNDQMFEPFQELANNHRLTIAIGMPTKDSRGIKISMLIFQPNHDQVTYSKQLLHSDELPYFIPGNHQTYLNINNTRIAVGICYETMQRDHLTKAMQGGTEIYIASVAKHQEGISSAKDHFELLSREFNATVLMVNSIGPSDNFIAAGQSSVWNRNGNLVMSLNEKREELLYFQTNPEHAERYLISD